MSLRNKIELLVDACLAEPDKKKIGHIEICLPVKNISFQLIDTAQLLTGGGALPEFKLAFLFSFNQYSRTGKRILNAIFLLNLFDGATTSISGQSLIYFKVTDNNKASIANEVIRIIESLFPSLELEQVKVELHRKALWHMLGGNPDEA